MKHLKLFETETDYDSEVSEFEYPTVSLVQDVEEVRYMTLRDKYTREYLTFEALEDGTFTLNIPANVNSTYMTSISYSTDNGSTWVTTQIGDTLQTITTPTITARNKVLWKGVGKSMANSATKYSSFSATGNYIISGNVMSLLYEDEFINQVSLPSDSTYNFCALFRNNSKLISAENLILPATTLTDSCYRYMFSGCTALTITPSLPATTLTSQCYSYMFKGCTSLTTALALPATTLANVCYGSMFSGCTALITAPTLPSTILASYCYSNMFSGCTSLTTTPELPATTLASSCYQNMFSGCTSLAIAPVLPTTTLKSHCYESMFSGCTSLTVAPELPATTLENSCYSHMFEGCTSLTTAPELPTTTLVDGCYQSMFQGCTALITAPTLPSTTLKSYCYTSMFQGCTSLITVPAILPATTLKTACYQSMFQGCTSLTIAPELPATTLASYCYQQMFSGCTNLNYIKAMFTITPSTSYTRNWVQNVAATGTFVKNSIATWTDTGVNSVPNGWTVQTASA